MGLKAAERILHFGVVDRFRRDAGRERQRPADEVRHALADQFADDLLLERRITELIEERIDRGRDLMDRVEQRAVEIERDRADVDGRDRRCLRPGVCLARRRHRTAASSARIR